MYADVAEPPFVSNKVPAQADRYLQDLVAKQQFSGAVLIAKDGRIILSKGYGLANRELHVANTTATKFRIGSLTKQFTALSILLLQERGKLKITDSICRYLDDCPAAWQPISLHHLLTHTSGISNNIRLPTFTEPVPPETVIESVKDLPLDFKVGSQFNYSNPGYMLLGMVIEKVSGKDYFDFLKDNIFTPLRMNDTDYDDSREIILNRAAGYTHVDTDVVNADYTNMSVPFSAGALHSTVEDFLRWDQALYAGRLISQKSFKSYFSPFLEHYAYGWVINQDALHPAMKHGGRIDGFTSFFARYPKDKVTVIIFANMEDVAEEKMGADLRDMVFLAMEYCAKRKEEYCSELFP